MINTNKVLGNILGKSIKSDAMSRNKNKAIYVNVSKPLKMEEFNLFEAPMGWLRSDLIKEKLKSDKIYRSKFTNDEIRQINNIN